MPFKLRPGRSLRKELQRIARKQIDHVLELLATDETQKPDDAVHDSRKALKRLRALARFARPTIGEQRYRRENVSFRNAGRPLTDVRDGKVVLETWQRLCDETPALAAEPGLAGVSRLLEQRLATVRVHVFEQQQAVADIVAEITAARERVSDWTDVPHRWSTIRRGLKLAYRRAAAAYEKAFRDPTVEPLHEWRKQIKSLRYQLELLTPIAPEWLAPRVKETDELGELLGKDHDLAVLWELLADELDAEQQSGALRALRDVIEERQAVMREDALLRGRAFFESSPKDFVRPLKLAWKAWRERTKSEQQV